MNTTTIVGWKYDADLHCPGDTALRFGAEGADMLPFLLGQDTDVTDSEGNPVTPVLADEVTEDDVCGDCFATLL